MASIAYNCSHLLIVFTVYEWLCLSMHPNFDWIKFVSPCLQKLFMQSNKTKISKCSLKGLNWIKWLIWHLFLVGLKQMLSCTECQNIVFNKFIWILEQRTWHKRDLVVAYKHDIVAVLYDTESIITIIMAGSLKIV